MTQIESDLRKLKNDSTGIKYCGSLEMKTKKGDLSTELDKAQFVIAIEESVRAYGLETFFYLPDLEGVMRNLSETPHLFTVQQVIDEHESRLTELFPVMDATSGLETEESIKDRFVAYDNNFERFDITLSRRIVESLILNDLLETIRIKYSHAPQYKTYPGSVVFIMALNVSNASAEYDIEGAIEKFKLLTLASYPGENIVDFATEAQRLIKIMQSAYALPHKTGSELLAKIENTESKYFNVQIGDLQKIVKKMERSVGLQQDPKQITLHSDYPIYGPLGLCALMQEEYGELRKTCE